MTQQPARETRRLIKKYQRLHRLQAVPWSEMSEAEKTGYFDWFQRSHEYQPGFYQLRQRSGVHR